MYTRIRSLLYSVACDKKIILFNKNIFFFFFFFFFLSRPRGVPWFPEWSRDVLSCHAMAQNDPPVLAFNNSMFLSCNIGWFRKFFRLSVKYATNYFWISPILVDFSGSNLPKNSCDSFSDSPLHADASPILIIHIFRRLIFFISEVAYRTKPRAQYFSDPGMKIFPILQKCHTRC